jgi:hypothetical protein
MAAARSLYADKDARREADGAIATTLRFREVAVRKLPTEQRVNYVVGRVRPDDSLAASLLVALHLDQRRPLLEAFLTALEIPQKDGVIDPDHELQAPDEETLSNAIKQLDERFEAPEINLYMACLLAMDPDPWAPLIPELRKRL